MPSAASGRPWLFALLAFAALLSTCDGPFSMTSASALTPGSRAEVQQMLQGTWLRETNVDGVQARGVIRLQPGGAFTESVRVASASGAVRHYEHAGTWLYDGTNLKRKYTSMDGEPPSRLNLPFATLQVTFDSRNDFVGTDNIHGHEVRYHRVPDDTQP